MTPLPEKTRNSLKITFLESNPMTIIKSLFMITKNHNPPFWRQNLTVTRHLPVYDVNVTSQTKKLNNWRTKRHGELVNPSFCSLWVGDSFTNNFIQNYSPSVWKYTENAYIGQNWISDLPKNELKKMSKNIFIDWDMFVGIFFVTKNFFFKKSQIRPNFIFWKSGIRTIPCLENR